jgi:dihydropteroate synthase
MGIINLTPDSFSDGGRIRSVEEAVAIAQRAIAEGAAILDLGGESSRPGAEPVPLEEELRRVIPAVRAVAPVVGVPISVDTYKAEVARQAIQAGAVVINDITALRGDPLMDRVAAETGAGIVLMHMQGTPRTMQQDPRYQDVVPEVYDFLARRIEAAVRSGIPRERIAIDPGIGFGKTNAHSLEILRKLDRFANLGCVILIGISRKGLLGKITGRLLSERDTASAIASLISCSAGARVARVHDVAPMSDAIKIWGALRGWEVSP